MVQFTVPEIQIFGKTLSFGDENLMMTLNDMSFYQKKVEEIFYRKLIRQNLFETSPWQVSGIRNPLNDFKNHKKNWVFFRFSAETTYQFNGKISEIIL